MRISDWSSYVCSSDLIPPGVYRISATLRLTFTHDSAAHVGLLSHGATLKSAITDGSPVLEIESQAGSGRAPCGERVCQYVLISVVAGALKQKTQIIQHMHTRNITKHKLEKRKR